MRSNVYEKPSMKFVDIRNQQNVAANCWSQDANGNVEVWYYDYSGTGYVKFHMGGNCDAKIGVIDEYYNVPEAEKDKVLNELRTKLAKQQYDPTIVNPNEPPAPGTWS